MDCEQTIDPWAVLRYGAAPAVEPAAGVLVGASVGLLASSLPLPWVALLLACSLALANRAGRILAAVAVGLFAVGLQPVVEPQLDHQRPVEVVAVVSSHPVAQRDETFFRVDVRRWRQRHRVAADVFALQVTMPLDKSPPPIGATVRLRGYLKRPVGFANQPTIDPGPWRMRLKSQRFLELESSPGLLMLIADRLRHQVEGAIDEIARQDSPGTALMRSLLLGDRSKLPKAWQQALKHSGLAHLLAVSGLHVGLLALLLLFSGRLLPARFRMVPAILGIVMYLLVVGPRPSMSRAAVMGLVALAALAIQRPPQGLNALACCVAVWTVHDPRILGQLGFQLSFAASAGILILLPAFNLRWSLVPRGLRGALAVSVAAQLATMPWIAPLSGGVHLLSPWLNLVAIPWLACCLVLAFVVLAFTLLIGSGDWMMALLDFAASPVQALADLGPFASLLLPFGVSPTSSCLLALAGVAVGLWPRRAVRFVVLAWCLAQSGAVKCADPELIVLDVGQGDATLLRDGRQAVLIDGGGWPNGDLGGRVLVPALAAMGIRRLDAVLLTHPDMDHCAGLVDVVRYLPVSELWMGPGWLDSRCVAELLAANIRRWRVLWQGEVEAVGRWRLRVLHPSAGARRGRNGRSLVIDAAVDQRRVLLTGDIEQAAERQLTDHYLSQNKRGGAAEWRRFDVLKVAHHGSKTSTSDVLLRAVAPRLAVISCGVGNHYGHPHPTVIERLQTVGATVLRTDQQGMIRLRFRPEGPIAIELPGQPRVSSGK